MGGVSNPGQGLFIILLRENSHFNLQHFVVISKLHQKTSLKKSIGTETCTIKRAGAVHPTESC